MNKLTETTKEICENGDLTHDYAVSLARMVDTRDVEIKRLLSLLEEKDKALERIAKEWNDRDKMRDIARKALNTSQGGE
jgi:hypothetical protein